MRDNCLLSLLLLLWLKLNELLATQFLGLKVLRLPNAEISDSFRVRENHKFGKRTEQNHVHFFSTQEPQKDRKNSQTGHNPTDQNGHYNPSQRWAHFRFFCFHLEFLLENQPTLTA